MQRRIAHFLAALALLALPLWAGAQATPAAWPSKPIHLLVPFPPGGPTDITARLYAEKLTERLGQPVIVENKPGPNGIVVYNAMQGAQADGHTLAFVTIGGQVLQPAIQRYMKKPVEPDVNRLLKPVGLLAETPLVLVVNPKVPVDNVKDLLAWLRANSATLNYASDGVGSTTHLAMEMFNDALGIKAVHVPFKGTVASMNAVMRGDAQYAFAGILTPLQLHKAGRLKILAVSGGQPVASVPEAPVLASAAGIAGFDVSSWFAMFAPADVPADRVAKLNAELQAIARQPDVAARFESLGLQTNPMTASALAERVKKEQRTWEAVMERARPAVE
ncbi:Bug family tripartite tricarboxylate transporter substrate binding protein [Hydrogenophaga sp. BPS33]|uniref:Bug family tripartite tricarboxylate transporter substrate binding protein n=1 Tax=Hydrogenophaga sp. BPS33 TaxID=2651974 RepID=UPI00131F6B0C|nr:tripartite tricarboxylate transporter substrate binding protein [Hydrogenophaga sp. BPS33]QHE84594.1 tripartite tricarboxylate transporter substrate binding protein [Hydrogenophaga sp. BPS33]